MDKLRLDELTDDLALRLRHLWEDLVLRLCIFSGNLSLRLRLRMENLVLLLKRQHVSKSQHAWAAEGPTQFFLKQSCEQKILSSTPALTQVGHCKVSASLSQSAPRHLRVLWSRDLVVAILSSLTARRDRKNNGSCECLRRVYDIVAFAFVHMPI